MTSTAPPGAAQSHPSPNDAPLSWEGDKMYVFVPLTLSSLFLIYRPRGHLLHRFNIYIYDYCYKRGYKKTAKELQQEADIPENSKPPINARQGLLFE